MSARAFSFTVLPDLPRGNTVIDQMASRMTAFQLANGGRAVYSFELAEPQWRFLGENHAGTDRMLYKPSGRSEINDSVGSWGSSGTGAGGVKGRRAFEGGPAPDNVNLLQGAGGAFRCFWDSTGDAMWHIAGATGSQDVKQGVVKYNAGTDEFLHWTSGGPSDGSDTAASLWPGHGSAHNFGTSAWDPVRRRLYKLMRLSAQGDEWWMCRVDVAGEAAYATREAWIAGHPSWMVRDPVAKTLSQWPQTVFVPEVGTEGSVFVINTEAGSNPVLRFDCATSAWSAQYPQAFDFDILKVGSSSGGTLLRPGAMFVYAGGYVWALGHVSGGLDNYNGTPELWRFSPTINGLGAPTVMATPPVVMSLAGYSWPGHHTEACYHAGKIYCFHGDNWEQVSGTFTAQDFSGGVYCYDIATNSWGSGLVHDSWTQKLLAAPHNVDFQLPPHNFTATEVPRLGVFLMAQAYQSYLFGAWLFKPAL